MEVKGLLKNNMKPKKFRFTKANLNKTIYCVDDHWWRFVKIKETFDLHRWHNGNWTWVDNICQQSAIDKLKNAWTVYLNITDQL